MSRPTVVVADPLSPRGLDLLAEAATVVTAYDLAANPAPLAQADALVVRSGTQVTRDLLSHAPRLRIIGRAGIGVDNIDIAAATERGILVVNSPQGNVRSTAEHTLGLMFALARRIVRSDAAVRAGRWREGYEGIQLAGKRLGVIGAGKVGAQVIHMARAIGMEVVAYDPYLLPSSWQGLGAMPVTLDELLTTSDVITLHVPLVAETRNLIDAEVLSRMKGGALLINAARGGLVDEEALAEALRTDHLGGAAVDVFTHEPLRASPLLSSPNIILTPHIAASTREAQAQVTLDIVQQLLDYFDDKPVAHPINPAVLRRVIL